VKPSTVGTIFKEKSMVRVPWWTLEVEYISTSAKLQSIGGTQNYVWVGGRKIRLCKLVLTVTEVGANVLFR
jgi:hypothetical protein